MNKNWITQQLLQLIDGVLVCLAFWITSATRNPIRELLGMSSIDGEPIAELGIIFLIAIPLIPLILEARGFYRHLYSFKKSLKSAIAGSTLAFFILFALLIAIRSPVQSRYFLLGLPPVLLTLLMIRSQLIILYHKNIAINDARKTSVQLIGQENEITEFLSDLTEEEKNSWDIQESIDLDTVHVSDLVDLIQERSVALVIILASNTEFRRVSSTVELCEAMGIETMLASNFLRTKTFTPEIEQIGGKTMISLRSTPSMSYSLIAKKLLDRVGSLLLILATSPLWAFAAVGIRLKSPKGPIFFKQQRAGLYGRPFTMWKFRTMHPDAESMREEIIKEHGNQMDGPVFKLDDDPRVFSFGNILRKTSIDELPQLINVLKGEISLVGPRPLPLVEVEGFQKSKHRRRLSMKPGITCFWQAGGRNSITNFEEWVEMDLKYIDNWSFLLDLKILVMTIPAVLFSKGAK